MTCPVAAPPLRPLARGFAVSRTFGVILALLLGSGTAAAGHLTELRVCGDPDNLPYSNEKQEGFENRIAEVVAKDLGVPLRYYWWPHQRGLVRNTLGADKCDVLIGIPKGYDPVLWTRPYYRSTHAAVYRTGRGISIHSLDDPALRQLRIGVHRGTPPHDLLAERGILGNVVSYTLFHDPQDKDPEHQPTRVLAEVLAGSLDVAIVWGPWAGDFARKHPNAVEVVPLQDPGGPVPLSFEVSMGVKKGARELRTELEGVLGRHDAELLKILDDYGVPRLPLVSGGASAPPPASTGGGTGGGVEIPSRKPQP
jgi:mxaJ protein